MEPIAIIFVLFLDIMVGIAGRNKRIGFWGGFLFSLFLTPIIGIIIVLLSYKKGPIPSDHMFVHYNDLAMKAESKGQYQSAIKHYKDSLNHLENDYVNKKLDPKSEEGRQKKILRIKAKIEELQKASAWVPTAELDK